MKITKIMFEDATTITFSHTIKLSCLEQGLKWLGAHSNLGIVVHDSAKYRYKYIKTHNNTEIMATLKDKCSSNTKSWTVPSGGNCYIGLQKVCKTGDPAYGGGASAKNICNITEHPCDTLKVGDELCIDCNNTCPAPPSPSLPVAPISKGGKLNIYGTGPLTTHMGKDLSQNSNLYMLANHIFTNPKNPIAPNSEDVSIPQKSCIGFAGRGDPDSLNSRRTKFVKDFYRWQSDKSKNTAKVPPDACAVFTAIAHQESRFSDTAKSWDTLCDADATTCKTPYSFCDTSVSLNPVGICDPSQKCQPVRGGFGQIQVDLMWYANAGFTMDDVIPTDIGSQLTAISTSQSIISQVPFPENVGGGWGVQCVSGTGPHMYPEGNCDMSVCHTCGRDGTALPTWKGLFQSCHANTLEGNAFTQSQFTAANSACMSGSPTIQYLDGTYYAKNTCPTNPIFGQNKCVLPIGGNFECGSLTTQADCSQSRMLSVEMTTDDPGFANACKWAGSTCKAEGTKCDCRGMKGCGDCTKDWESGCGDKPCCNTTSRCTGNDQCIPKTP